MAGQPQENPWSQQGPGYPQGAPGYGPAYDQQGQPAPYPPPYEQPQYEQPPPAPAGYEPQPTIHEQQPEYGYPGQPQAGQPQPRTQEQQDWRQWEAAAQQQARAQNQRSRTQGQKPKPAGGHQGFVSSLFDFGFTSFVTPKIIKALYAVVTVWTILWAILLLFIGNHLGHTAGLLFVLIIVDPLLILLSLGLLRVALEFFMITFRMQEDLKALREQAGARGDGDTVVGRVSMPDA